MTASQLLQVQRFNASASVRGVLVKLHPSGPIFTALVQPVPVEPAQWTVSKEERNYSLVFVLRSAIGGTSVVVGSSFINRDTGDNYRVAKIDDNSVDVRITFRCETTPAP